MRDVLLDLYAHMQWADARVWEAVLGNETASDDRALKDLLVHLHLTQQAFLDTWKGCPFEMLDSDAFDSAHATMVWARDGLARVCGYLTERSPAELAEPMIVPWAHYFAPEGQKAGATTLGETMLQVALHSAHHRAQANRLLRIAGAEPPLVDYIGWLWAGRPDPRWRAAEGS